jgi:hypothetical protein
MLQVKPKPPDQIAAEMPSRSRKRQLCNATFATSTGECANDS